MDEIIALSEVALVVVAAVMAAALIFEVLEDGTFGEWPRVVAILIVLPLLMSLMLLAYLWERISSDPPDPPIDIPPPPPTPNPPPAEPEQLDEF